MLASPRFAPLLSAFGTSSLRVRLPWPPTSAELRRRRLAIHFRKVFTIMLTLFYALFIVAIFGIASVTTAFIAYKIKRHSITLDEAGVKLK